MTVYAGVSVAGNSTGQTTSGTPGTYSDITAGALTKSAFSGNGLTADASGLTLTVQYAADYEFEVGATVDATDAAGYLIGIAHNGSVVARGVATIAAGEKQNPGTVVPITCAVGDVIKAQIASDGASKQATVTDMQLIGQRMGGA